MSSISDQSINDILQSIKQQLLAEDLININLTSSQIAFIVGLIIEEIARRHQHQENERTQRANSERDS